MDPSAQCHQLASHGVAEVEMWTVAGPRACDVGVARRDDLRGHIATDLVATRTDGRPDPAMEVRVGAAEGFGGGANDPRFDAPPTRMDRSHPVRAGEHDGDTIGRDHGEDQTGMRGDERVAGLDPAKASDDHVRAMDLAQANDRGTLGRMPCGERLDGNLFAPAEKANRDALVIDRPGRGLGGVAPGNHGWIIAEASASAEHTVRRGAAQVAGQGTIEASPTVPVPVSDLGDAA